MSERDAADRRAAIRARVEKLLDDFHAARSVGLEHRFLWPHGGIGVVVPREDIFSLLILFRADMRDLLQQQADADAATIAPLRALIGEMRDRGAHYRQRGQEYPLEYLSGAKWRERVAQAFELDADQLDAILGTVPHA